MPLCAAKKLSSALSFPPLAEAFGAVAIDVTCVQMSSPVGSEAVR